MVKSIKHFAEESIKNFEKLEDIFFKNPEQIAEYVLGITKELHVVGLLMIKESLETMNQMLKESGKRQVSWVIEKELITSLGTVTFTKTLFTHKQTGEMKYLLDELIGLKKHERMTDDASAKLLKEAVQTSYRRGGEECSLESMVSKQTVKIKSMHWSFQRMRKNQRKRRKWNTSISKRMKSDYTSNYLLQILVTSGYLDWLWKKYIFQQQLHTTFYWGIILFPI